MEKNYFREIPKVDTILADERIQSLIAEYGRNIVTDMITEETDELRSFIAGGKEQAQIEERLHNLIPRIAERTASLFEPNLKRLVNATGTILHTNLGRALINRELAEKLADVVSGYSNLEYNLQEGKRGERYSVFAELLCRLTGAEAAMAVNNNAAAVMLVLNTLAKDGEVIVSRGELVEIGGKFRVPDVCAASGAALVEVGTTNKTHLQDYKDALSPNSKAILKVHTSNYSIIGFTESVGIAELKPLCEDIPLIEDLGSGVLVDLSKFGLRHEPTVQESVQAGADIVCFSGDKLLGGPQAGIIVGKKKYIDRIKKNQLTRALRIDKFTVAALELVLMEYLKGTAAEDKLPVLRMMKESYESVLQRARILKEKLSVFEEQLELGICDCHSQIGGGSLPGELLPSAAVCLKAKQLSTAKLEEKLRKAKTPLIVRTMEDRILLDIRTVQNEEFDLIVDTFGGILQ